MITQRRGLSLTVFTVAVFFISLIYVENSHAMHIMEGFLPKGWSLFWFLVSAPFVVYGFFVIKKIAGDSSKHLILLAMCGAFAFVLSALKIPSVTGSCSHPTGVGLGAVLFGPAPMAVIGTIILLFQAILLAHGGISTLGANVFSMAVAGPFAAYAVYRISLKIGLKASIAVFLAAFSGDIFTYLVTSTQLAAAFPDPTGGMGGSLVKFLSIFALTQLPLAVSEGLLSVIVYNVLAKYDGKELQSLSALRTGGNI